MPIDDNELARRFTYHAPRPGQIPLYQSIRDQAHAFAQTIAKLTPESREQSLAITALEECVSWANAAIARSPLTTWEGWIGQVEHSRRTQELATEAQLVDALQAEERLRQIEQASQGQPEEAYVQKAVEFSRKALEDEWNWLEWKVGDTIAWLDDKEHKLYTIKRIDHASGYVWLDNGEDSEEMTRVTNLVRLLPPESRIDEINQAIDQVTANEGADDANAH